MTTSGTNLPVTAFSKANQHGSVVSHRTNKKEVRSLRPYESSDLSGVMETYTASIRTLAVNWYSPEQIAAWAPVSPDAARWKERLAPLHTIVAESEGVIAGFASYTLDGYLDFLFTHPQFARRGVASSLYYRVESAMALVRATRITTHASLVARPFFEHHGFQVDREECVECRGTFLRRFAMHKLLSQERERAGAD